MSIAYILLLLFGGYVALKYYALTVTVQKKKQNQLIAPPGVNYYCTIAAPSRDCQVMAFGQGNFCQTTQPGFAASLGPNENQPETIARLEI